MSPSSLARAHIEDTRAFDALAQSFARANPGYEIATGRVHGEARWRVARGARWSWLVAGTASVGVREVESQPDHGEEYVPLQAGDVVVLDAAHEAWVRGTGHFVHIAVPNAHATPPVGVRRLAALPDVAGGCNVGLDAFRRLQITWQEEGRTPEHPDGDNLLGCHVLFIASATSRTHYHPVPSRVGGMDQHELYLVLDPADHGFASAKQGGVWTYPQPGNWTRHDWTTLRPGDVVSIKAGVAHRAVDILACVIAIPGFKPGNDIYIDDLIAAETGGTAPHNPRFAATAVARQD
jgi:hypothetical protein